MITTERAAHGADGQRGQQCGADRDFGKIVSDAHLGSLFSYSVLTSNDAASSASRQAIIAVHMHRREQEGESLTGVTFFPARALDFTPVRKMSGARPGAWRRQVSPRQAGDGGAPSDRKRSLILFNSSEAALRLRSQPLHQPKVRWRA